MCPLRTVFFEKRVPQNLPFVKTWKNMENAGDPIYASASGTVIIAKYSATAGNYITIDHGNGFSTVYMHCSALKVSVGDTVTQGQTIGLMGTTGNSYGVHLHFAMIKNGTYVNPQSYL